MVLVVSTAPRATYRVQLHREFPFDAATNIAEYLSELGVSHLYCSPYLQSGKGSTHGYDVLNHARVNEELGGAEGHARMCRALGKHGLGQVLDIVPNHMSIAARDNAWWWDVLENGQASRYADYFDVDWQPPEKKLHNMVLLPILGDHYGRVLEAGEIQLQRDGGAFTFRYHDHIGPVAPRSLDDLLSSAAQRCESDTLAFLAEAHGRLPLSTATDRVSIARRHRDKEVLRAQVERLCHEEPQVAKAIDKVVARINSSPDELDNLLERQNYRLAYWRAAGQDLDYRRFFDINTLISLRMEDERVFSDTHALVLRWLKEGVLDGLRIDHPDGLLDPEQYLARLHQAASHAWIVVEKILEPGEELPETWSACGTTGYDFLNRAGELFIDPEGEEALTRFYTEFTGQPTDYLAIVHEKKHLVLRQLFGSDMNRLTSLLASVCERHRRYRDYTRRDLHSVLRELIACFPVYRTYVQASIGRVTNRDVRYVAQAVECAKIHRPDLDADLFDFVGDLLLLKVTGELESEFVMRFQQHTGPVMAKGVEDTTFYNFNRLAALNEVGGDPGGFGLEPKEFHAQMHAAQERWPQSMLASTTHDTKRSEDVRARISLLSEIPEAWAVAVRNWSALNERHKRSGMPDANTEYLLYQTLVGAWPIETERAVAYMQKAAREAKAHTSWTDVKQEYEEALRHFTEEVLGDGDFRASVDQFVVPLVPAGRVNSLSQTLLKLTCPGVPDIYQGTELWDLSLVDPDNRRAVDYELRKRLLVGLRDCTVEQVVQRAEEGLPKMWLIRQALASRKRCPDAVSNQGAYRPLPTHGEKAAHVLAYSRGDELIAIVPRLVIKLGGRWDDTVVDFPEGDWHNELTSDEISGGQLLVSDLLRRFPVALFSRSH